MEASSKQYHRILALCCPYLALSAVSMASGNYSEVGSHCRTVSIVIISRLSLSYRALAYTPGTGRSLALAGICLGRLPISSSTMADVVFANAPQFMFTISCYLYNNVLASMLTAAEHSSYGSCANLSTPHSQVLVRFSARRVWPAPPAGIVHRCSRSRLLPIGPTWSETIL